LDKNKNFDNLIQKLRDGDKSAFDEIYNQCYNHVLFVCLKFCSNKEDAEEVVQDTFITLLRRLDDLRGETLLAYLRKIAVNECYHRYKKNTRRQEFISDMGSEEQIENYVDSDTDFLPEAYLQNKEKRTELLQIIEELPKNQREVIYLYYYVDINTEQIAKLLECRVGSVHQALYTARKTIKNKLQLAEDKNKKKAMMGVALIPLADVLFIEEQIFVASYAGSAVAGAGVAGADAIAKADGVGKIVKACVAVGTGVAVCTVGVMTYFALQQEPAYEPREHDYAVNPSYIEEDYVPEEPVILDEPDYYENYEPQDYEVFEYEPQNVYQPQNVVEIQEPQPQEPAQEVEDVQEPEDVQEEDKEYPIEETLEEPPHIDRTNEILAALATATTDADVQRIIEDYDFTHANQIRTFTGEIRRFYVTDEGSGDILIGTSAAEGNSQWRMSFQHFTNGRMPEDIIDLFRFMD